MVTDQHCHKHLLGVLGYATISWWNQSLLQGLYELVGETDHIAGETVTFGLDLVFWDLPLSCECSMQCCPGSDIFEVADLNMMVNFHKINCLLLKHSLWCQLQPQS